ncbi:hypothetical protein J2S78_001513 [Salibacterium salarium]|nr:hypothetical protein [Salibacterium salarium]
MPFWKTSPKPEREEKGLKGEGFIMYIPDDKQ